MLAFLFHCTYERNLSKKSLKAYQIDLTQFISFLDDSNIDRLIENIDKLVVREYLKRISDGKKPKTIKRKIATLKAFFNYLEFDDVIMVNPFRKIRIKIKEGKSLPRTIPLQKIISIL
jgi:integrase/recombinase XerD